MFLAIYLFIMEEPLLISFSGGRTSAFMTRFILEYYDKNADTHILFANTGKENEETLVFVNECAKRWNLPIVWLESDLNPQKGKGNNFKVVSFETASRKGEPFERLIRKYGLPNRMSRFCSGKLKIEVMEKYMKSLGYDKFKTAIGIRADEPDRIRDKWYPLFELGVTKSMVNAFWQKQDFDLGLKDYQGNCDLCHLKSLRKRQRCIEDNPKIADWWIEMEDLRQSTFDLKHSVKEIKNGIISQTNLLSELDVSCICVD
jgi:Phosphoadenosine phosphosulfate reductase family